MSNIIDFCPVGALTNKFIGLTFRPWEDVYIESIDLTDSFCSSIRILLLLIKLNVFYLIIILISMFIGLMKKQEISLTFL